MSKWDGREIECDVCWEPFLPLIDGQTICGLCDALLGEGFVEGDEEEEEE